MLAIVSLFEKNIRNKYATHNNIKVSETSIVHIKNFENFEKLKENIDKINFSTRAVVWRHRNGWFYFLHIVKDFNHYPQKGCSNRI